jgi:hypothetical protein
MKKRMENNNNETIRNANELFGNNLLNTIKVPRNLGNIRNALPKP